MTEWTDFGIVGDNIVTYLLGSYATLGVLLTVIFLIILMTVGLEFKYALPLSLPIIGLFSLAGWFGSANWILNATLMVVALVYAFAITKIFGR